MSSGNSRFKRRKAKAQVDPLKDPMADPYTYTVAKMVTTLEDRGDKQTLAALGTCEGCYLCGGPDVTGVHIFLPGPELSRRMGVAPDRQRMCYRPICEACKGKTDEMERKIMADYGLAD